MKNLVLQKREINAKISNIKSGTENRIIEGFIPYDTKSERMFLGYTAEAETEVITRTAFNKTLGDKSQVFLNYNHDQNLILGSTRSGTLQLENRDDGLHFKCELPDTDIGNRAYQTIKRGDVSTLSFEFYPRDFYVENGISFIRSAQLEAISCCVPFPAYSQTDCFASFRTLCEKRSIDLEQIENAIKENKATPEQTESVQNLINYLTDLLPEKTIEAKPEVQTEKAEETEQPKDIPVEVTLTDEQKAQLERLESLQKELQAELN